MFLVFSGVPIAVKDTDDTQHTTYWPKSISIISFNDRNGQPRMGFESQAGGTSISIISVNDRNGQPCLGFEFRAGGIGDIFSDNVHTFHCKPQCRHEQIWSASPQSLHIPPFDIEVHACFNPKSSCPHRKKMLCPCHALHGLGTSDRGSFILRFRTSSKTPCHGLPVTWMATSISSETRRQHDIDQFLSEWFFWLKIIVKLHQYVKNKALFVSSISVLNRRSLIIQTVDSPRKQ